MSKSKKVVSAPDLNTADAPAEHQIVQAHEVLVATYVPVMDPEQFAKSIGISYGTVRGMIDTNRLPTVKRGKRRLINIAALNAECMQEAAHNNQFN